MGYTHGLEDRAKTSGTMMPYPLPTTTLHLLLWTASPHPAGTLPHHRLGSHLPLLGEDSGKVLGLSTVCHLQGKWTHNVHVKHLAVDPRTDDPDAQVSLGSLPLPMQVQPWHAARPLRAQ